MRQPSAQAAAIIALSQYEKPLVILIRHVKASFPERACVGARLAKPDPAGTILAVLAVIFGYTSASCRLFGAETLDLADAEPPSNSGDAGCYSLFFCGFASVFQSRKLSH